MATDCLYEHNAYLKSCKARVEQVSPQGIILNQTIFYPRGGGQAGDRGWLVLDRTQRIRIAETLKKVTEGMTDCDVLHIPEPGQDVLIAGLRSGDVVGAEIDWEHRYRLMRLHTASHMLCALLPYPVDGCSITSDHARLDFVTTVVLSREEITAGLIRLTDEGHRVSVSTLSEEDLANRPEIIRTLRVKPPRGMAYIRMVSIEDLDMQPCGGTHVMNTRHVGALFVSRVEKKSAHTRRITLRLL